MPHITNLPLCKLTNRINMEFLAFGNATILPPWHGHVLSPVFSRLYYITDGSFIISSTNGKKLKLEKGQWYLIPAQYSFRFQCNESMKHFYFHIKLCDFDGTDLLRSCKAPLALNETSELYPEILNNYLESTNILDGLYLRQKIMQTLLTILQNNCINIQAEDYSPCVYKGLTYIKQNLSIQLSVSEIAEHIYVSKSTLTKHFKAELGMGVNEYICNTIMAEAERLLMTTSITIGEVSEKLGFSDQLYFSRRFKEIFGKSPREYRKNKLL